MKLWPYHSFDIETALSLDDCIASLSSEVEPNKWFRFSTKHKIFQGVVSHAGFKITRIVHYRNSFLPVVYGTFRSGLRGTTVAIKMRMHPWVTTFMCVWFGGVGLVLVVLIDFQRLIPLGMLIFGLALINGGFWFEVKRTKPEFQGHNTRLMASHGRSVMCPQNPTMNFEVFSVSAWSAKSA